ncbi:LamG domain-containing protein [Microbulbifer sp. TRSA005]|uniref:LamG domain-containing protein n=1 Tax=Microbulbifer sp. TRSA005 TaxID=3243383 RepID=UPI00403935BC
MLLSKGNLVLAACLAVLGCKDSGGSGEGQALESRSSQVDLSQASAGFFAHYTRVNSVDIPEKITGPYADIIVNLEGKGKLVFARDHSYRPVWHFGNNSNPVAHLADISSDANTRFDKSNDFSYVRILEQSDEKVVIHWRYFPKANAKMGRDPEGVVHEIYTITRDGNVTRLYRPGTDTITDWDVRRGAIIQTMRLTENGIADVQNKSGELQADVSQGNGNAIVNYTPPGLPVAHWKFDEGKGTSTVESLKSATGYIDSHGGDWVAGVSGSALFFDGYRSAVVVAQDEAPIFKEALSIEAWINLAAYPWNNAPIIHQSDNMGNEGYYFGVSSDGKLLFTVNGKTLISDSVIPVNQWVHVGVSAEKNLSLYINGVLDKSQSYDVNLSTPDMPMIVGMNNSPLPATDGVRESELNEFNHFSSIFGIDGAIDEIAIYKHSRTSKDFYDSYNGFLLAQKKAPDPSFTKRQLPDLEKYPQKFGGIYTKLDFHDAWDNLWRVTNNEDIVVRFDNKPISYVYWRGTSHGMNLVTDNRWMSDQSVELVIPDPDDPETPASVNPIVSLAEHMSDKAALRTHVRMIENTPARVKVHWRYAAADVFDLLVMDTAYIDEVHTIYPDGVAIRDVFYHPAADEGGVEFYQDFQWLLGPGQKAEDFLNYNAVSIAGLKGDSSDIIYPISLDRPNDGVDPSPLPGNIAVLNSQTNWKVFGVSQAGGFFPSANEESSEHIDFLGGVFPFAGPWNHWPIAQIPSDGRFSVANDRVSHFAVGNLEAFEYGSGSMMYGFTQGTPVDLQDLASSWISPPVIDAVQGVKDNAITFITDERAYSLTSDGVSGDISLLVKANDSSPLVNPSLIIRQWRTSKTPKVKFNGKALSDVKLGIIRDTDGSQTLIVWLPVTATMDSSIEIIRDSVGER